MTGAGELPPLEQPPPIPPGVYSTSMADVVVVFGCPDVTAIRLPLEDAEEIARGLERAVASCRELIASG